MNDHVLVGILYEPTSVLDLDNNSGYIGFHDDLFVPQLPTMLIDSYSTSSTASTNNVDVKGR